MLIEEKKEVKIMKCKVIHNPKNIPSFEDFEKIEEFEYDGVLELLQRVYQPPGNICWVLDCENGKLHRSENNVFLELGVIKNTVTENRKIKEMTNKKYTAKLKVNNDRVIEVEGLSGPFSCQFIGCTPPISESDKTDEDYCCDECLLKSETDYDDEEITKDLMLDEVISSQKFEIDNLKKTIEAQQSYIQMLQTQNNNSSRELINITLKLVELLGKK